MAIKMGKKQTKAKKVIKKVTEVKATTKVAKTVKPERVFETPKGTYVGAVGRRKVATARVRIYENGGDFVINGMIAGDYFKAVKNAPALYNKPFEITGTKGKFAVTAKVSGSGLSSQLDAVVHGIARALAKYNPEFKTFLKQAGLITRDDRMKETRKIGMGGKARRKRQSPKR